MNDFDVKLTNMLKGAVRHPCSSWLKPVTKKSQSYPGDNCDLWSHIKCENSKNLSLNKLFAFSWIPRMLAGLI